MIWLAAIGWASFFTLAAVWLSHGSPDTILVEEQKKVMQQQSRAMNEQQQILDRLFRFYNIVFKVEQVKLGARLAAEGKDIKMVAIHDNPVLQEEAQKELDAIIEIIKEAEERRKLPSTAS